MVRQDQGGGGGQERGRGCHALLDCFLLCGALTSLETQESWDAGQVPGRAGCFTAPGDHLGIWTCRQQLEQFVRKDNLGLATDFEGTPGAGSKVSFSSQAQTPRITTETQIYLQISRA